MTADSNDILQPLSEQQMHLLLKVLENDFPSSIFIYNWIKKQLEWASKLPSMKVLILCPYGNWSDGTVIGITYGLAVGKSFAAMYSPEKDGGKLKRALMRTKHVDWETLRHFSGVLDRHVPLCMEVLRAKGFQSSDKVRLNCNMHYVPKYEFSASLNLPTIPYGVRIGPLDVSHLDYVCDNWPLYTSDLRPVVSAMLELNPSVGVFVRNDDGEEELASMVLQSEYGGLGLLQTVPKHREQGYAALAVAYLTEVMGRLGFRTHGHTKLGNLRAQHLFQRAGFKIADQTNWITLFKSH
ncbi:uncharacterized protein LOC132197768 [Neocloeon triangulifer]|uniref:uncharacterized protein LOC132197768 n=1 Tax=Neocloeon triangulifer TaxID=2078957 RepID=UPI00286F81FA|nr:uncharacterized protein LOC132197768 [Neocloeon triangulifer]